MAKTISKLNIGLSGTFTGLSHAFKGAVSEVKSFASSVVSAGSKLAGFTGIIGALGAALGGLAGLAEGFSLADQYEQATVQLTALAGSANNAKAILGQLKDFTANSPFEFPDLLEGTKRLLSAGVAAQDIKPLLQSLGEVAAGTGVPIGDLADLFARVQVEGKVGSRELLEFGRQGIPVMQALAAHFHTTTAGVQQLAENGQIGFKDLQGAFASMAGPGGRFAGIIEAQAQTVGGQFKRLKTGIGDSLADVATTVEDSLNFAGLLAKVNGAIGPITGAITSGITRAAPYIMSFAAIVWHGLGEVWGFVEPIISGAWNFITGVFSSGSGFVSAAMGFIWQTVSQIWGAIWGFVGPIVTGIYNVIADNWQAIVATIVGAEVAIWDVVSSLFSAVFGIASQLWNAVTSVFNWGASLITGQSNQAADGTTQAFTTIWQVVKAAVEGITESLEAAAFVLNHWKEGVLIVGLSVALGVVTMGNVIGYVFGTVIPAWLGWLSDNWLHILNDIGSFTATIFSNIADNVWKIFKNLPGLIAGTTDWSSVWTPMATGFQSTIGKFPDIAARQTGGMEQALTDQLGDAMGKYGQEFSDHLNSQADKAGDLSKKLTTAIQGGISNVKAPDVAGAINRNLDAVKNPVITPTLSQDTLTVGIQPEIKQAKLLRYNTGEAAQASYHVPHAYLLAAAGLGGTPAKQAGLNKPNAFASPVALPTRAPAPLPVAPGATGQPTGAPNSSNDPLAGIGKDIQWLRQIIVKWDGNFPLANATF